MKILPEGLDETYSQILLRFEPNARIQALSALKWLAFSARPLELIELSEAAIVDPTKTPAFNESNRFFAFRDVEAILSGLVIVEAKSILKRSTRLPFRNFRPSLLAAEAGGQLLGVEARNNPWTRRYVVRLAHFSVKEYLMSDRIKVGASSVIEFYITETACHTHIAESCLYYHLYVCQTLPTIASKEEGKEAVKRFPLWQYAADYWATHMEAVPSEHWSSSLTGLARRVLRPRSNALLMMLRISQPHFDLATSIIYDWSFNPNELGSPLYYIATQGRLQLSSWLLENKISGVNEIGGMFKTALNVASVLGHETLVRLLLCAGANPYQRDENSDFSLSLAIKFHRKKCAMILLAEPNVLNECHRLGYYPLIAACLRGMTTVVKYLLKLGADVNAYDEGHDTALISAVRSGKISLVELLIGHGADVNAQSGLIYGNALQIEVAAAWSKDIVRLLLKHGAKVDPPGQKWENLLREAHPEIGYLRKSIEEVRKSFRDLQRMCGEPSRRSGGMTEVEIDNYFKECWEDDPIFN